MSLEEKINETFNFVVEQIQKYRQPVFNCSFGKDSMVLLHILLTRQVRIPIIYYTDPWYPQKNDFANSVISAWRLEVHNYPPAKVSLMHGKEIVALVSEYQTGANANVAVMKNALEFKDGDDPAKFLCGLNFLMRPCSVFVYPWDVALVAHKDCDEDQIYGVVPLHSKIVYRDEGPDYIFPLKEWTHDEIWDYTLSHHVPYQQDRYDAANRREWPDKSLNSDWYEVCLRCIDKRIKGQKVWCPKMKVELQNMAEATPEYGWVPDYFGTERERMTYG